MAASTLPVRNPRTGEWDHEIPVTSSEDIASITAALRAEQAQWVAMGTSGRAACLNRFADAVMTEVGPLGQALSIDTGRSNFAQFEAIKSVELIRMWAERAGPILDELAGAGQSEQVPTIHYQHRLIPYQVVAVISPWNVPLLLAMIDSLAALSAGCSV